MFRIALIIVIVLMPLASVLAPGTPTPVLFMLGCFVALAVLVLLIQDRHA